MAPTDPAHILALDADCRQAMDATARHSIAFRGTLDAGDVTPRMRPADLVGRFEQALPDAGQDALSVIEDLVAQATDGIHGHASPGFSALSVAGRCQWGRRRIFW